MNQIEPNLLWLGNAGDCRDPARVLEAGIQAVVQLAADEPAVVFPREMIYLRIPLYDGADNTPAALRLAVATVQQLLVARIPTLICCGAGMSRSPAVAACALARLRGEAPAESLRRFQGHVNVDISPVLWRDLLAHLSRY